LGAVLYTSVSTSKVIEGVYKKTKNRALCKKSDKKKRKDAGNSLDRKSARPAELRESRGKKGKTK